jgi:hypothetical protein
VAFRLARHFDAESGVLRLRSIPASECGPVASAPMPPVRAMVWDHRRVGANLVIGEGGRSIPLGDSGVYPFDSVPWLAATAPRLLVAALEPIGGQGTPSGEAAR